MPKTIEEDGKTIEVYTPEELETQKAEAIKAATEPLQTKLTEAEEKLKGISDKDANFAELRKAHQDEIAKLQTQITEETGKIRSEFEVKEVTKTVDTLAKKLADGDAELEKKLKYHYDTTLKGVEAKDEASIAKKMRDAWQLATAKETTPDALASVLSSAGAGGAMDPTPAQNNMSPELAGLTKKVAAAGGVNITDEDIKKYDPANKK